MDDVRAWGRRLRLLAVVLMPVTALVARVRADDAVPPVDAAPPAAETLESAPQAEPPQAEPPQAEPPAPSEPPAEPPGKPRKPRRRKGFIQSEEEELPWPGRFVAIRTSFGAGNAVVPRFILKQRANIPEATPYFGVEGGYTSGHWGAGFTVDVAPFVDPSFLSSSPLHLIVGFQVNYVLDPQWRLVFGFDPFVLLRMEFQNSDIAVLRGVGWRVGAHRLLTRMGRFPLEAFAAFSGDYFTSARVGTAEDAVFEDRLVSDFLPVNRGTSSVVFLLGLQIGFPL